MQFRMLLLLLAAGFSLHAQKNNIAYAISSNGQPGSTWTVLKKIDLSNGSTIGELYKLNEGELSAACAYDQKNNRLYFSPIFKNELRYIDLKDGSMKVTATKIIEVADPFHETNHITRMVIGSNGNGYALSNDGKNFVEFNTGKKSGLRNLGSLTDDASNKEYSIFDKPSWGGDLIADDEGKLYLISAQKRVFKIDPSTGIATFRGIVNGIPGNYSTNGAVVDDEGMVVVSNANNGQSYYRFSIDDLQAELIKKTSGQISNSSDLANGNFILCPKVPLPSLMENKSLVKGRISIQPNPVTIDQFKMIINEPLQGRYELQLVDGKGKQVMRRPVVLEKNLKQIDIPLPSLAKGVYYINLIGAGNKPVANEKLIRL